MTNMGFGSVTEILPVLSVSTGVRRCHEACRAVYRSNTARENVLDHRYGSTAPVSSGEMNKWVSGIYSD